MDNKNKSVNERWAPGTEPSERGYATDPGFASASEYTQREYAVDRRAESPFDEDPASPQRAAEIRRDIDRTRADMGETLDAIQDRLRPGNIASRAAQTVKDTASEKVRQMGQTLQSTGLPGMSSDSYGDNPLVNRVRDNPVAAAIAAASLAWLAFGGRGNGRRYEAHGYYDNPGQRQRFGTGAWRGGATTGTDAGQTDWTTTQAQRAVGQTTSQLRDKAQDVRNRGRQFATQSPIGAGMLAAVAGLAIGLMIPETERENELMGDARDSLIDRGRETVKEAAEQVQRVATDVTDTAKKIVGGDLASADVRGADNP